MNRSPYWTIETDRDAQSQQRIERRAERLVGLIRRAEGSTEGFFEAGSRSFSYAARLFPEEPRRQVAQVYAFCRITDDLADSHAARGEHRAAAQQLRVWRGLAARAHAGDTTGIDFLDRIMAESEEAGVRFETIEALIEGVATDLGPVRIQDWEGLRAYCYGVASVIGVWMTQLYGVRERWLLERAEMLGYALQLTNILRDVGEDLDMDRIYLPAELMAKHGVTEADLQAMRAGAPILPAYRELVEEVMAVAEHCYGLAREAMPHLPGFYARPVAAAAEIYRGILPAIRRNDYDNLRRRARTSAMAKPMLAARGLATLYRPRRRSARPVPQTQNPGHELMPQAFGLAAGRSRS